MKTENQTEVGMHAFERAGLGKAPFRFVAASENVITYPDGSQKAGGSCDYCSTGIRLQCHVRSADGREFKVGCNCIEKVGDAGLLKAYKTSAEFRAHQRKLKADKNAIVIAELNNLVKTRTAELDALPHPMGFTDRDTGKPLTAFNYTQWMIKNCGATGRATVLRTLKRMLSAV